MASPAGGHRATPGLLMAGSNVDDAGDHGAEQGDWSRLDGWWPYASEEAQARWVSMAAAHQALLPETMARVRQRQVAQVAGVASSRRRARG